MSHSRSAKILVWLGATLSLGFAWPSLAAPSAEHQRLQERYASLAERLNKSTFGEPLYIQSEDREGVLRADVYGVLPHAFETISATLGQPSAWCDFVTLHFNIKGCTFRGERARGVVTIYSGGKQFVHPRDAARYDYAYTLRTATPDFFHASVTADKGPLDTHNYRLEVQVIPLGGRSFVHVKFSCEYRLFTRMASATYFSLAGRNKIGFSIIGTDAQGKPVYSKGRSGAMERTVMRYYLALQTVLDSAHQPEAQRFEWRIQRWYDLTERYPRQLYELEEEEYLRIKRDERAAWSQLRADAQHNTR